MSSGGIMLLSDLIVFIFGAYGVILAVLMKHGIRMCRMQCLIRQRPAKLLTGVCLPMVCLRRAGKLRGIRDVYMS